MLMTQRLKKHYLILLMPALVLFGALGAAQALGMTVPGQFKVSGSIQSSIFVLASVTAIAGPLLVRTLFAHSLRNQKTVEKEAFMRFQQRILNLGLATPYLAFMAVLYEFPKLFSAGIALMALYAAYYYFPSEKRIQFDCRIFRVTP